MVQKNPLRSRCNEVLSVVGPDVIVISANLSPVRRMSFGIFGYILPFIANAQRCLPWKFEQPWSNNATLDNRVCPEMCVQLGQEVIIDDANVNYREHAKISRQH